MTIRSAFLYIILVIPVSAFADTLIQGTTLSTDGNPIAGCEITVLNQASSEKYIAESGSGGKYEISGIPIGSYRATARCPQHSDSVGKVIIGSDEQKVVDFQLVSGIVREEVVVTATRTETDTLNTPESVTRIDSEKLLEGNYAGLGQLFTNLAGTSVLESGAFRMRPSIRGLNSNRILILVDGDRLNNSRTSTANSGIELGLVDPGLVDSIEVVRGSGSVLYGTDALSGTINILTRDVPTSQNNFYATGGLQSFLSTNANGRRASGYIAASQQWFSLRLSQTWEEFDNYESGNEEDAPAEELSGEIFNSGFTGRNTQVRGTIHLSDRHQLRAEYVHRDGDDVGVPGLSGSFSAYFPFDDLEKYRLSYEATNLSPTIARISTRVYYQEQKRNFTNILEVPGFFQFSETISDTDSKGWDFQMNLVPSERHLVILGSSVFQDTNSDSRVIAFDRGIFDRLDDAYRNQFSQPSLPEANFLNAAVFAQDQFHLSDRIEIVAGLRFDHFKIDSEPTTNFVVPEVPGLDLSIDALSSTDSTVSGNAGVIYELTPSINLTARVGRSFREPNLFERFFTGPGSVGGFIVPNPELKPESGWNVDTGIKFRNERFTGSVTYFNNTYRDFISSGLLLDAQGNPIVINPTGQRPVEVSRNFNVDRARIQGFETEFSTTISAQNIFLSPFVSFSYLRGDDLTEDRPLDFITPLKTIAGIKAQNRTERLWAQYSFRNVSEQDRLSPEFLSVNGGPEPGFIIHDVRGGFRWNMLGVPCAVTLALENLADRYYIEQFVFAPSQGRTFTLGLNLNY